MINGHSNMLTAFIKPRDDYLSSVQTYFTFTYTEMPILSVPFLTSTSEEEMNYECFFFDRPNAFTLWIYEELQPVVCDLKKKISHECGIVVVIFFKNLYTRHSWYSNSGLLQWSAWDIYIQEGFNISHGDCYEHF